MSIAFTKYSFAPLFFIHALIRREPAVFLAVAILLISAIAFGLWVGDMRPEMFVQPLLVAQNNVAPGAADLVSILRFDLGVSFILAALASIAAAAIISWLVRDTDDAVTLVILSLSSLAFFQHLGYDYVFLLPALGFLLSNHSPRGVAWKVGLAATVFYFFFFLKINHEFVEIVGESYVRPLGFMLMVVSIYLLLRLRAATELKSSVDLPLELSE